MKRIACFLLLSAGALSAQVQETPAPQPEAPAQGSVARQALANLGYSIFSTSTQGQSASAGCAIPLLRVPIPQGQNFSAKVVPAPSKIDPKILVKPPLPACPDK